MDPTDTSSTDSASNIASAVASIFQNGVTAYVDSQAIQKGYQIQNPVYYNAGVPGGQPAPYAPLLSGAPAGASLIPSSSSSLLLILGVVVVAALIFRKG
ncbi:MAG TPA: hypothetical protein VFA39_18985 [Steroidobacteraceae bacterium]|nr:hypothetical protein [Steroidobacteraceae bacterium]